MTWLKLSKLSLLMMISMIATPSSAVAQTAHCGSCSTRCAIAGMNSDATLLAIAMCKPKSTTCVGLCYSGPEDDQEYIEAISFISGMDYNDSRRFYFSPRFRLDGSRDYGDFAIDVVNCISTPRQTWCF